MTNISQVLTKIIEEFSKLPGIGPKTAQRLALYIFNIKEEEAKKLASAIIEVKEKLKKCSLCNNISEEDICKICKDYARDKSLICIVENPADLLAIEKTKEYKGIYYILMGTISPLEDKGIKELEVEKLIARLKRDIIKEVIIATSSTAKGEITATYLTQLLKPYKIKITRIAQGIPIGAEIEYADQITLTKALNGRTEI